MTRETVFALDELGNPDAPVGSRDWSLWIANQIRKSLYDKQQTGQRLKRLIDSFKAQAGWQELGFLTWEKFCEKQLQKPADEVEETVKLRGHGGSRRSDTFQPDNCQVEKLGDIGGNNAQYLTARIARDYPNEVKEIGKGKKYRTVHAAAVALGIKKPTNRHNIPTDPAAAGRYLASRVDNEWMQACYAAYTKAKTP